jgi:hypothetical protein
MHPIPQVDGGKKGEEQYLGSIMPDMDIRWGKSCFIRL